MKEQGADAALSATASFRPGLMQELELGPRELEALVAAVYPECLPSEFRHFQVHGNPCNASNPLLTPLHVVSYQQDSLKDSSKTASTQWRDSMAGSPAGDAVVLHCPVTALKSSSKTAFMTVVGASDSTTGSPAVDAVVLHGLVTLLTAARHQQDRLKTAAKTATGRPHDGGWTARRGRRGLQLLMQ